MSLESVLRKIEGATSATSSPTHDVAPGPASTLVVTSATSATSDFGKEEAETGGTPDGGKPLTRLLFSDVSDVADVTASGDAALAATSQKVKTLQTLHPVALQLQDSQGSALAGPNQDSRPQNPTNLEELRTERAAIREHDGGLTREAAELAAAIEHPCCCLGTRWWVSKYGPVICGTCHPPADSRLAVRWFDTGNAPNVAAGVQTQEHQADQGERKERKHG